MGTCDGTEGVRHEATDRTRRELLVHGDADVVHARGEPHDPRSVDGAQRLRLRCVPRPLRAAARSRPAVPSPARRGPDRPEPPHLDRGPRLRSRLAPAPHRRAPTRWHQGAVRAGRPSRGHPARSLPTPVGGLADRRSRGRSRRRAQQGAPRRDRRRVGRGAPRRHPRHVTRDRAEAGAR